MQYIGKIDINKIGKYKDKILTNEVILTLERIEHIKEHHPGDYEKYKKYIPEIIYSPDYILNDNKNKDTVLCMKNIKEIGKNVQVVIRINTSEKNKQNSILTLWQIKEKNYKQMIRNKEIIRKNIDNEE